MLYHGRPSVFASQATFTEVDNDAETTYTADVVVPGGAVVLDVIVHQDAAWGDGSGAMLNVGDFDLEDVEIDADGFFAAVDLTGLGAGEALSFAFPDSYGGSYLGTTVAGRFSPDPRVVRGTVVAADGDGSTGVTRLVVVWCESQGTAEAVGVFDEESE